MDAIEFSNNGIADITMGRIVIEPNSGKRFVPEDELTAANKAIVALSEALDSIARNTCCGGCQEAAKVAQAALKLFKDTK